MNEYKRSVINPALEVGMDLDTSDRTFGDDLVELSTNIKDYLTQGLNNYAKESRQLLSRIGKLRG